MQEGARPFFSPLRDPDRKWIWLLSASLILMTLHMYEGNEKFFLKHFSSGMEEGPLLDWYKFLYKHTASLILFFIIPAILIKTVFCQQLSDFGLTPGDWKFGLPVTLVACLVLTPMVYVSSRNPEFRELYPLTTLANESPKLFLLWGLTYLPHYIGWEFLFRGFLGLGMKEKVGSFAAILIPTAFTVLLHLGKPEGETWSTIPAGIFLGLLTFRTRSVMWAILFHFYAGMANTFFAGW